jgi:hypothetical protein
VADEKAAKRIKRLAKRTVTVTDVVAIVKGLTSHHDQFITQLMDKAQIQERVLVKLGATDEMIQEATKEYYEELNAKREELLAAQKSLETKEEE